MKYEDMSLTEVIDKWQDENRANNFSGSSGVRKLERLCKDLGYEHGDFVGHEVSLLNFLADNPGAMEAIVLWIGEQDLEQWKDNLISTLPENDSEDEDEEDDDEEEQRRDEKNGLYGEHEDSSN